MHACISQHIASYCMTGRAILENIQFEERMAVLAQPQGGTIHNPRTESPVLPNQYSNLVCIQKLEGGGGGKEKKKRRGKKRKNQSTSEELRG